MSELNIVHLSLKSLKAALCIAAKEDIRYYLNGVLVEAGALVTRVVATDGHMLFAHDYKHGTPQWEGKFIIQRDTLEMLTRPRQRSDVVQVEIIRLATHKDSVHEVEEARFVFPAQIGFKPVQGVFPDYRRVIPAKVSGEAGVYNSTLVAAMEKARKAMGGLSHGHLAVYQGGADGCALVDLPQGAIGVMMPFRNNDGVAPDTTLYRENLHTTDTAKA